MRGALVVVGDLVEDVVVRLSGPLRPATDNDAVVTRRRGGSAANVAAVAGDVGAARHHDRGVPVRFVGCVGADAVGDALVSELASHGVEVVPQRRGRTGTVVCLVDEAGERTMFPDRGAAVDVRSGGLVAWLDGAAWLHLPSYGLEPGTATASTCTLLAREAFRRAVPVSLDISSTGFVETVGIREYVRQVESLSPAVVLANADEALLFDDEPRRLLSGGLADPDADRGVATLAPVVAVKNGPDPVELYVDGRLVAEVPTRALEPAPGLAPPNSTGAGDAFAAGFLTHLIVTTPDRAPFLPRLLPTAGLITAVEAGHAAAAGHLSAPLERSGG